MTPRSTRFQPTAVSRALFTLLCGAASLTTAHAQQSAPASGTTLQRVEITGSNIRRVDSETASPVQVITKEDIDNSGKATVGEYLQTLTADGQGSVPTTYGRGFAGASAAGISLRGLGANATLVLVNGRRVAPAVLADDAQRTFVDLNSIPLEAVERVEVVKDGASSIYGSDAVAGVVNIILKKNFTGTVLKATYGMSQERDGKEPRFAITHGMGTLEENGFNALFNFEIGKKEAIYYRDRKDRDTVGRSALAYLGFPHSQTGSNNIARQGGNGVIPTGANGALTNNSTTQSIVGNVRNPVTNDYYSRSNPNGVGFTRTFPGAATYCNANANLPQNDPGRGCITDLWREFGQVQPEAKTVNLYGRFTKAIDANTEAFFEAGYYTSDTSVSNTSLVPNGTIFLNTPAILTSNLANFNMGAAHPDNPYFGSAARLSYNPGLEIGAGKVDAKNKSFRMAGGIKGLVGGWDYDTAVSFSRSEQTDTRRNAINWRVANALMNPTAANVAAARGNSASYAALPAGTYWRIGENAGLNSAAMYDALLDDQSRKGFARLFSVDGKVSRELMQLDGGPMGIALGAEYRREANNLPFYNGLGDYIGLSYTRYGGERNIFATFAELAAPVTKQLELNGALRFDRYSDAGNSLTPKIGAKFRPTSDFALRSTYAHAFRAPTSTENNANSVAAFGGAVVNDRVRTAAGVPNQGAVAPTFVQNGNPDLEPEKSRSLTFGGVWDITPKTSLTADLFAIKRKGLPVLEDFQAAVDAGRVVRDPAAAVNAADPGPILSGFARFVNSNQSTTKGLDVEVKHRWDMGDGNGRVNFGATWTHLFEQSVTEANGKKTEYVGTHGDCHITNCMGTPKDRISLSTSYELGAWKVGAVANYRSSIDARDPKDHPNGCAYVYPDGTPAPTNCKVASFTTVDMNFLYKFDKNTEIFGSIANIFDRKPPFDPVTYGAIGYNPLDYSGAIGRYFRVGLKHKF